MHYNNTDSSLFFSSIDEIPNKLWKELNCTEYLYFNPKYLSALEKNNPQIRFFYVFLMDYHKSPIAFATIQIVDFYLESVSNKLQSIIENFRCFGRKFRLLPSKKNLKILTCGNTFVSGEHGVFIQQNQDKQQVIQQLAKVLLGFVNSNTKLKKEISAFMLKDFSKESLYITNELHYYKYYSFNVEPNMILHINKNWTSFNDYLASLKTKFRVKAKKAFKQSKLLKIKEITPNNIAEYLPKMTFLYQTVSAKADFNLGNFNLNTYKDLKENLGDNYILKSIWLGDKMVGFFSGMIHQKNLDAHFVGIDYELNRTYAIYQRMLYEYITIAIEKRIKCVNFGRTASEIKSSVGAIPQDLTIYVRHKKTIPNKLLKLFLTRIKPTPFQQKFPFKIEKITKKV